jgi:hypothetical protein
MHSNLAKDLAMFKELVEMFRKPSVLVVAQRELEDAQRGLLEAQSQQEYSRRIAEYQADRVKRLRVYLVNECGVSA